jgi:hypothetical protein
MGEEIAAARRFEAQRLAETFRFHRDQEEVFLAREVPRSRFPHLRGSGKMDEAIGDIDRRTRKHARPLRLLPESARADLVDDTHVAFLWLLISQNASARLLSTIRAKTINRIQAQGPMRDQNAEGSHEAADA